MPRRLLLASTNPAKQSRLRWLLEGLPLELVTPQDLGGLQPVEEDGATFAANSAKKVETWSAQFNCLALASDGGLVIPHLTDWDPLRTARFAGPTATDSERIRVLLERMRTLNGPAREAWFTESLALADRGKLIQLWNVDSVHGTIATKFDPAHYESGAWTFSLWAPQPFTKVHSALTPTELATLDDHWARLRTLVQAYFRDPLR